MDIHEITFKVQNHQIVISLEIDPMDDSKVFSNKYHYKQYNGRLIEMKARTDMGEIYQDIRTQISYLATTSFRKQDFFDAIAFACTKHIDKYNRLVLSDLWVYINVCMIIMDATNNIFHNHIMDVEQIIDLRDTFESELTDSLKYYIWVNVHDADNPQAPPKLKKLTEL